MTIKKVLLGLNMSKSRILNDPKFWALCLAKCKRNVSPIITIIRIYLRNPIPITLALLKIDKIQQAWQKISGPQLQSTCRHVQLTK